MKASCSLCKHFCQRSYIIITGQRNVSGGLAKYQVWAKHRCNLKQEDLHPNKCGFEIDEERQEELNRRYPDLALVSRKLACYREGRL